MWEDSLYPCPSTPGPVWPGALQVLIRGQRGRLGPAGLLPFPTQEAAVAAAYCGPCQCEPVGHSPSTTRGQALHPSESALILTRNTVGARMVRRGPGGGSFGLQVLRGGVARQQALHPSPRPEAVGSLPQATLCFPRVGVGEGIKKPSMHVLNFKKNIHFLSTELCLQNFSLWVASGRTPLAVQLQFNRFLWLNFNCSI